MTVIHDQTKTESRDHGGMSLWGCGSSRPTPARDYAQDHGGFALHGSSAGCLTTSSCNLGRGLNNSGRFSHSIPTRLCSLAGDRRVGGYDLPATRPVVNSCRAITRRGIAKIVRIELEPAKHDIDPFHVKARSYAVGFNANRHSERPLEACSRFQGIRFPK